MIRLTKVVTCTAPRSPSDWSTNELGEIGPSVMVEDLWLDGRQASRKRSLPVEGNLKER